jgi:DNA-binding NarL/FixJ family response regulator
MTLTKLTSRERKVLQLLSTGKTNKQIGFDMCVCEKTVEYHLGNLYTKTGARTRVAVVVWAMQYGLTTE